MIFSERIYDLWKIAQARGAIATAEAIYRRVKALINDPNSYLKHVGGVIHVGANLGQERDLYATYNLKVLWIEPMRNIFEKLCENIRSFPDQMAVNHLITDKDSADYVFRVTNADGVSSSILELARHKEIWPDIREVAQLKLKSLTLDTLLEQAGAINGLYQALVIDTQGSELLVLRGATKNLPNFRFIKAEAADFESYVGCARVDELTNYLAPFGFKLIRRDKFAGSRSCGNCFDLLYRKQ